MKLIIDSLYYSIFPGEFDHIERQTGGDTLTNIDFVITMFEDRCMKEGVKVNMLDHLVDILKNEEIFTPPFNLLARTIKKEKKKFDSEV